VLSFDGGGVRGLASLIILRGLMDNIREEKFNQGDKTWTNPRPCEYFDLICGTSTGGLIAIMLGRLGMVSPPESYKVDK
jgi:patatin-like phospholipase/acyl hydrolase